MGERTGPTKHLGRGGVVSARGLTARLLQGVIPRSGGPRDLNGGGVKEGWKLKTPQTQDRGRKGKKLSAMESKLVVEGSARHEKPKGPNGKIYQLLLTKRKKKNSCGAIRLENDMKKCRSKGKKGGREENRREGGAVVAGKGDSGARKACGGARAARVSCRTLGARIRLG